MAPLSDPHQGRARALLGASLIFLVLAPIFVALRIWARRLKRTSLCFNDYAIIIAMIFTCGYNVNSAIGSIKGGLGQHIFTLTSSELTVFLKGTVVDTLMWPTANTLVKISVLHFYTKIFGTHMLTYSAYALGAVTMAYWLSTVLIAFLICRPFAYNWDKITIKGHCGDTSAYYLSTGIVNLLIDVAIVALPLPLLWSLQMKTSRKFALTAIFSLGAVICIISVIRVVAISRLSLSSDVTYHLVLDNICTSLEPTLGVINACLPILQPVISRFSGSTILMWSKWKSSGGTSRERLGSNGTPFEPSNDSKSRKFHRIPADIYPLTDVTATQSHCTGPGFQTGSVEDADSFVDDLENYSGIKVKQHVGVESRKAPPT